MRLLVIGGSGFMGKYVVADLAARGHDVGIFGRGQAPSEAAHVIVGDRKRLGDSREAIQRFGNQSTARLVSRTS